MKLSELVLREAFSNGGLEPAIAKPLQDVLVALKAQKIKEVPLGKLIRAITVNGMKIDLDDVETVDKIKDFLPNTNWVEKIEGNKVIIKVGEADEDKEVDEEDEEPQERKDEKQIEKKAKKQAKKAVKNDDLTL